MDKKRAHPPIFSPVTATTLGEFGPGVATTREWLATRYRQHLAELEQSSGPRPDGRKAEDILARFRDDFNMMIAMVAPGGPNPIFLLPTTTPTIN